MKEGNVRGAGILLPVSSLPSPYGIGTFGKAAYTFVDQLVAAGQRYWQVLPLGQTSYGDSPYQALSAFAGNPYFIDLERMIEEELLERSEVENSNYGNHNESIQYDVLYESRYQLLRKAYKEWLERATELTQLEEFVNREADWLDDYTLYMACKIHFQSKEWSAWDDDIKYREVETIARYKEEQADEIGFWQFIQYRFYQEWGQLKEYANHKGIRIIGDIPLYVAMDSADVWVNPQLFQLNEQLQQVSVAGCPPDAFSDDGQKWGNPLYNWEAHEAEQFKWWKRRMQSNSKLYDLTRIDHFIGIVRYYCIPFDKTAVFGWYEKGPGMKLVEAINSAVGSEKIIAEDLGVSGPDVEELLAASGYPGMKELEVAFDGNPNNDHLPHLHKRHSVVYIGTHDNETLKGHLKHISEYSHLYMMKYIGAKNDEEIIRRMMSILYMSVAEIVILQIQDILEKDNSARMNSPSTMGDNWKWRLQNEEFSYELCQELDTLATVYGRK